MSTATRLQNQQLEIRSAKKTGDVSRIGILQLELDDVPLRRTLNTLAALMIKVGVDYIAFEDVRWWHEHWFNQFKRVVEEDSPLWDLVLQSEN